MPETMSFSVISIVLLLFGTGQVCIGENIYPPDSHTMFPKGFLFGAASAAYQFEGAWNEDGKGPSIWDTAAHKNPNLFVNGDTGDVAVDFYHKHEEDLELLQKIGFQVFKLSISWARVLPNGTTDYVNEKGVDFYNALIDGLLSKGILPLVTIYHWDLPQALEDLGGWLNPKIVDYFVDYADFVFDRFGNRIKWWITINEGYNVAKGYEAEEFAPGLASLHGVGNYIVAHNLLLAHGKAYRLYEKKYKKDQDGKVSMAIMGFMCAPLTDSEEDIAAAERCFDFTYGLYAHPIYIGDYPPNVRAIVDKNSRAEGRNTSRLPYFSEDEIKMINGSADFFALHHYVFYLATTGYSGPNPSLDRDTGASYSWKPEWGSLGYTSMTVFPQSLRMLVNKIVKLYGNVVIFITEHGYGDRDTSTIYDPLRISFYEAFLAQLRNAIYLDGCNVIGYITWSFLDNLEWFMAYSIEFGLVDVDVHSPNRTRRMKQSAQWMKNYIAMHKILYENTTTLTGSL